MKRGQADSNSMREGGRREQMMTMCRGGKVEEQQMIGRGRGCANVVGVVFMFGGCCPN